MASDSVKNKPASLLVAKGTWRDFRVHGTDGRQLPSEHVTALFRDKRINTLVVATDKHAANNVLNRLLLTLSYEQITATTTISASCKVIEMHRSLKKTKHNSEMQYNL